MSKISELSDGGNIQDGDTLIAVRSGGNVKVTYDTDNVTFGTVTADGLTVDGSARIEETGAAARLVVARADNTNSSDSASLDLLESNASGASFGDATAFGYRLEVDGSTNEFNIKSGNGTTIADRLSIGRDTGDISFYDTDGSTASFVYDASAGLTINEAGADRDFRVESNNNSTAFFIDAGTDQVLIGSNSVLEKSGADTLAFSIGNNMRRVVTTRIVDASTTAEIMRIVRTSYATHWTGTVKIIGVDGSFPTRSVVWTYNIAHYGHSGSNITSDINLLDTAATGFGTYTDPTITFGTSGYDYSYLEVTTSSSGAMSFIVEFTGYIAGRAETGN